MNGLPKAVLAARRVTTVIVSDLRQGNFSVASNPTVAQRKL